MIVNSLCALALFSVPTTCNRHKEFHIKSNFSRKCTKARKETENNHCKTWQEKYDLDLHRSWPLDKVTGEVLRNGQHRVSYIQRRDLALYMCTSAGRVLNSGGHWLFCPILSFMRLRIGHLVKGKELNSNMTKKKQRYHLSLKYHTCTCILECRLPKLSLEIIF